MCVHNQKDILSSKLMEEVVVALLLERYFLLILFNK
jgi:hypothetical protein